jgi:hypothetical protein
MIRVADREGVPAMHITYLSPAWPPAGAANGIVTYVSVMRDYLMSRGHDVSVLAEGRLHLRSGAIEDVGVAPRAPPVWPQLTARLDRRLGHHPFTGRRIAGQLRAAHRIAPHRADRPDRNGGKLRLVGKRAGA